MRVNVDGLRQRVYALANAETEIRGDAWEMTALIGGPHHVECDGNTRPLTADATGPDPDRWPEAIPLAKAVVWPRRLLLAEPELAGADVRFAFLPRNEIHRRAGRNAAALHDWRPSGRHLIAVADDLDADELERLLAYELGHARHAHYIGAAFAKTPTDRAEARAKAAEDDPDLRAAVRAAITVRRRAARRATPRDAFAPEPRAQRIIRRDERTAIRRIRG
jgi:hypothetical protein